MFDVYLLTMNLKQAIKNHIPRKYIYKVLHLKKMIPLLGGAYIKSYSGNGEDIILTEYLFKNKENGFFVDVGSFHPIIISNTYKLSKKGWTGINIDPNPETINIFNKYRKKDTNLQIGVSSSNEDKYYYNFSYSGANTIDTEVGERKSKKEWNTLLSKELIKCYPLSEILEKHANGKHIDLLDIDVEGHDLEVLKSNNWEKFTPSVILVEDKDFQTQTNESAVFKFLKEKGYSLHSYCEMTLIMTHSDYKTVKV